MLQQPQRRILVSLPILLLASAIIFASLTTTLAASFSNTCPATAAAFTMTSSKLRSVKQVLPRPHPHWVGDGFKVYPVFGNKAFTKDLSPLLMFDYAEPKHFPPKPVGSPLGVGQHPHRGFETVTVAFQGEVEHHDSTGNSGIIGPGDVQWMTAGRGIIHQEYHSREFTKQGGTFEMCQLWVNLPKKHKMTKPKYQAILNQQIPTVTLPVKTEGERDDSNSNILGTARIIAGELGDTKGKAKTFSPVQMWDVSLPQAGSEVDLPFPPHHNCILFVRRGSIQVVSDNTTENATKLGPQDVALMTMDGSSDTIRIRVNKADTSIMVLGGEPIDEPIASRGPFVMNTQQELDQAMMDYRNGRFGK